MSEIFNSNSLTVSLSDTPTVKGHLVVENKKNLELCSDDEAALFFAATSQCATALFELLGAHGTNILIQDTPTELKADILSRMENDGVEILWQPTRVDPNELDVIAKKIKDEVDVLVWKQDNPDKANPTSTSSEPEVIKQEVDETTGEKKKNYMMDHLKRRP